MVVCQERLQVPSRAGPRERTLVLQVPELYGVELLEALESQMMVPQALDTGYAASEAGASSMGFSLRLV